MEIATLSIFHPDSYSSSSSRPGMYSKLTSKTTGLFAATLGLPGAEVRPFGNANWSEETTKQMSSWTQIKRKRNFRIFNVYFPTSQTSKLCKVNGKSVETLTKSANIQLQNHGVGINCSFLLNGPYTLMWATYIDDNSCRQITNL